MKPRQVGLKKNMLLYAIRGMSSVIFPLISYPYIAQILGAEQVGRSDFSKSIVSYFLLIAGLGISAYAIREGAKIRYDKDRIERLLSDVYSIGIVATIISYSLLFLTIVLFDGLRSYTPLILIYSIQVFFVTFGVEWVYSIYEDYLYITIRTVLFQLLNLILLLAVVKKKEDIIIYALVQVITVSSSHVINRIYACKYVRIHLTHNIEWRKHLKPIIILFAMSATVTVYVSSDVTMLGLFCGDKTVGIYSVAVNIYSIIKLLVSSVIVVSVPKVTALIGRKRLKEANQILTEVYIFLFTLVLPIIIGIIVLREQIILIISSKEFASAATPLTILAIAVFFCMGASFWAQCVLVPSGRETTVLRTTVICAVTNIVLNAILIPIWKENAAAFTTAVSEGVCFILCRVSGMKYGKITGAGLIIIKSAIGCFAVVLTRIGVCALFNTTGIQLIMTIVISVTSYFWIELWLRNDAVVDVAHSVRKRIAQRI